MTVYPPAMPTPKGDDMLLGVVKQHLPGSARARFPFTRPVQQGSRQTTGPSGDGSFLPAGNAYVREQRSEGFGGGYSAAMFAGINDIALSVGEAADDFPWMQAYANPGNGIYFSDGSADPSDGSTTNYGNLWMSSGLNLAGGACWLFQSPAGGFLTLQSNTSDADATLQANDNRSQLFLGMPDGQDSQPVQIRDHATSADVFTVARSGRVVSAEAVAPGAFATADRPSGVPAGGMIFDTDLVKPVWSDGAGSWVDATGASV